MAQKAIPTETSVTSRFSEPKPLAPVDSVVTLTYAQSHEDDTGRLYRAISRWRAATLWSSSLRDMMDTESFQLIVDLGKSMGRPAVQTLLTEISEVPDFLFVALHLITGEDPVQDRNRGDISESINDWLLWAEHNGYRKHAA